MSFTYLKELPSPGQIKNDLPLGSEAKAVKAARDAEINAVLSGESDKFLVIIGPCSADSEEPVMDYIHRLARINEQTKDR
ncbi:MAG: 3-deoxy-7-phosphoheptulonate synthase, partial [Clostridiales bacterium]|nr:3-deoxy-7-phosphoheptulonate synthase [Clostridiales bacterium]